MKLVFCAACHDVFNLTMEEKVCGCGLSGGRYTDELNAEFWGPAQPIGFLNNELVDALRNQPESGQGERFSAFVIPRKCKTMKHIFKV